MAIVFVVCMNLTKVLVWVRGRAKQKCSLTFCVFGQIRSKCFSSSTFPKSQPRQNLSANGMPFHAPSTTSSYVLPHRNRATTDVTQVVFALVRHTFEAQLFCLCVGLDFAVGKKFFNESQSHIILHLFYTQHYVGKTWRGWGPSLLIDWVSRHRSNTNRLH